MLKQPEVFEMSTIPVELGKVEIPGREWNKIQQMLEERQKLLIAKSVIVESSIGSLYYKTLSEDQHVQELTSALQKVVDVKKELEEKYAADLDGFRNKNYNLDTALKEEQKKTVLLAQKVAFYKSRGFWSRVFNTQP